MKKSIVGPLMLGMGAILMTMIPVMMGGLAILSSKAVLISKLAMVVSVILFVQYFFRNGQVSWKLLNTGTNLKENACT